MELIQKIINTLDFLDEIENLNIESQNKRQIADQKEQDLLHYMEINKLKSYEMVRLVSEFEKVRKERREAKDSIEVITQFKSNILQMQTKAGREQLRNMLKRQEKKLKNRKYINRVYKEEELDRLIKGENKNEN